MKDNLFGTVTTNAMIWVAGLLMVFAMVAQPLAAPPPKAQAITPPNSIAKATNAVGDALAIAKGAAFANPQDQAAVVNAYASVATLLGDAGAAAVGLAQGKGDANAVVNTLAEASTLVGRAEGISNAAASSEGGNAVANAAALASSTVGTAVAQSNAVAGSKG